MRDTLRSLVRELVLEGWESSKWSHAAHMARIIKLEEKLIPLYLELSRLNRLASMMPSGPERDKIVSQIPELESQIEPLKRAMDHERAELERNY